MSGADTSGQYGEDRPGLRSRVGSTSAATANTKADQIVQVRPEAVSRVS